jgi:hypothetical protein
MCSGPASAELLGALAKRVVGIRQPPSDPDAAWVACGAAACTGPSHEPLLAPRRVTAGLARIGAWIETLAAWHGAEITVDPFMEIGMRAAVEPAERHTRLLAASDEWLALSLVRQDDIDCVPAWLQADARGWEAIAALVRLRPATELLERGIALGLPIARVGETAGAAPAIRLSRVERSPVNAPALRDALVIDLSSLWAGPLCARLLQRAGANVVKVESTTRPDGARRMQRFYEHLHAGQDVVRLNFDDAAGRAELVQLLERADIVVTGSRPRALEQLGIDPRSVYRRGRVQVWVAVTGHGCKGSEAMRVGFGDDTAAAGGLVAWHEDRPYHAAYALADPATGLVAAAAALAAYGEDRVYLDVALARVAGALAGHDDRRNWRRCRYG